MNKERFYVDRHGDFYSKTKEYIIAHIDPYDPATIIPVLREMDYPFFEDEWLRILGNQITTGLPLNSTLGKYIAKMQLSAYKPFTFKDSKYTENVKRYRPLCNIKWRMEKTDGTNL